jgi:uncharacterized RDD family membrane protein YckC
LPGYLPRYPEPTAPDGRPLAKFTDRLLAYLIDAAVFFGVGLVLAVPAVIGIVLVLQNATSQIPKDANTGELLGDPDPWAVILPLLGIFAAIFVVSLLVSYIYFVEMLYKTGTTWGKRAMKLKIVPLVDPTAPLTRGIAAKRWAVAQLVGAVLPLFSYLDGFWQLWDWPYQQCLHDKWAGTIVVKVA